ncbi:DUF3087 domain-containing protein [Thalassotalea insulae]|uniref:DUF3087 domain-containing protein n=1 Tax=Thalassotalea insulae TaxID=2056778 RepID=A0ABQ6GYP3_9GAMM|nr:DUF3087 family protein [Thalassotalea insulae]GLX80452.1 DUF3087 domain-containing protein [Thalassotalea insulae]
MQLEEINKTRYRQHLNRVIIGFILVFALLSLGFSSVLISLFSEQGVNVIMADGTGETSSNFKYNFLGVMLALLACAAILHSLKSHAYFKEIYYVWQAKQVQNLIYRKLKKIKVAAFENNDVNAMIILNYYYASLKQVYLLDDNTLTLTKVTKEHQQLIDLIERNNIDVNGQPFNKTMLNVY